MKSKYTSPNDISADIVMSSSSASGTRMSTLSTRFVLSRWNRTEFDCTVIRPSITQNAVKPSLLDWAALILNAGNVTTGCLRLTNVRDKEATIISNLIKARTKRSEEHTSELQSLMRISYAVF